MPVRLSRVLFAGHSKRPAPLRRLPELTRRLRQRGLSVWAQEGLTESAPGLADAGAEVIAIGDAPPAPDWVVTFGGDGAFLEAARRFAPAGALLTGVNLGYLGFLTDIAADNMIDSLVAIADGGGETERRFMFSALVSGESAGDGELTTAVNDVVISRGGAGVLLNLRVSLDGIFAYNLRADGLILATPSGSTAYALSAGGPIVAPNLDATLLAPLCPHSLTHRPLAVRADVRVRVDVLQAQEAVLHIDGDDGRALAAGDAVEICRHPKPLKILHPDAYDYYQTLRLKLLWGE